MYGAQLRGNAFVKHTMLVTMLMFDMKWDSNAFSLSMVALNYTVNCPKEFRLYSCLVYFQFGPLWKEGTISWARLYIIWQKNAQWTQLSHFWHFSLTNGTFSLSGGDTKAVPAIVFEMETLAFWKPKWQTQSSIKASFMMSSSSWIH